METVLHVAVSLSMDELLMRARLAIDESAGLRTRRETLQRQFDREREELRIAVFESARYRAEIKARRDDKR